MTAMREAQEAMNEAVTAKKALALTQAKELAKIKADHKTQMAERNKAIAKAGRLVAAASKAESRAKAEAKAEAESPQGVTDAA
jgi:hypothetical protein